MARSLSELRDHRNLDAFNRLRVSSPVSQFEYQNQYNAGPIVWANALTGTGAVSHEANGANALMTTGGTAQEVD